MKSVLSIIGNRIAVCLRQTATQVDLEVLQGPGGSIIALLLLIRATTALAVESRRVNDV